MLSNPFILFPCLAVFTAATAVTWNRWYVKRLFVKEFRKQLRLELKGEQTMTVHRINWRQ